MKMVIATTFAAAALALSAMAAADQPPLTSGAKVKWGAPPPVLRPGAKFAVIAGDPTSTGMVTVRLQMPPGYQIAPHWHPTDEHVTVLSGTLELGMGDTLDKAHSVALTSGGYALAPANMHHYAWTRGGATIQVHLMGPFAITYVNPADDPTHAAKK